MLRMPFVDRRLGHRYQLPHCGVERLKFLRRTAHVVSILAPLLLLACAASAQLTQDPRGNPNNNAPVTRQEHERDIRALSDQIKTLHNENAKRDSNTWPHGKEWGFGEKAPVWSNWTLAAVAFFAGWIAYRAFNHERDAVRLTERADVLFVRLNFLNPRTNAISEEVLPWSVPIAVQKNFGRTTATNVRVRWRLFIEGDPLQETEFLPPAVIGPGAELETRMVANMQMVTGNRFNQVARVEATLRGIGELVYTDVFGKEHHATFRGSFRQGEAGAGAFAIDHEERD